MIDTYFRNHYQNLFVNPLLPKLVRWKLSPKTYTVVGLFFGLLVAPFLALGYKVLAFILLLLSGYFDTLDGSVARRNEATSPQGAVLDIVSDRIVEFSIILGLYLVDPVARGLLCLLMLGSVLICITSFLVVAIFTENTSHRSFHYSPGIMERGEAFIFFSCMILIPASFLLMAALFALLVTLTGIIRVYQFTR